MKSIITAITVVAFAASMASALPLPGAPQVEYGCGNVIVTWSPPDNEQYQVNGYLVYKMIDEQSWQQLSSAPQTDTTFVDGDLSFDVIFNYAVRAVYENGRSELQAGTSQFLPDPSRVDYLLVGSNQEQELNDWYMNILETLGLHGDQVSSVLPYCGDMLQDLRLLWIGGRGNYPDNYLSAQENSAVVDYLNQGGRLYVDNGMDIGFDTLGQSILGYGYTNCIPYPFLSIHGVVGTFSEGLWYQFPDSLYSSNMEPMSPYARVVLEDDVRCGCVDLSVERDGFKAVVNSQPFYRAIDNDATGTRLDFFRRMLQFFDILTAVDDPGSAPLPQMTSLAAYPNPFNAHVTLGLSGIPDGARITIYDMSGRLVKAFPDIHGSSIVWDGTNDQGQSVTSGLYFAKATSGDKTASVKLTLLK